MKICDVQGILLFIFITSVCQVHLNLRYNSSCIFRHIPKNKTYPGLMFLPICPHLFSFLLYSVLLITFIKMEPFLNHVSKFPKKKMVWSSKQKDVCQINKKMTVMCVYHFSCYFNAVQEQAKERNGHYSNLHQYMFSATSMYCICTRSRH